MNQVLAKKDLSEEDIKRLYITPALRGKWADSKITMETHIRNRFTDGKINIRGNIAVREAGKFADYILYWNENNPIAIATVPTARPSMLSKKLMEFIRSMIQNSVNAVDRI